MAADNSVTPEQWAAQQIQTGNPDLLQSRRQTMPRRRCQPSPPASAPPTTANTATTRPTGTPLPHPRLDTRAGSIEPAIP